MSRTFQQEKSESEISKMSRAHNGKKVKVGVLESKFYLVCHKILRADQVGLFLSEYHDNQIFFFTSNLRRFVKIWYV